MRIFFRFCAVSLLAWWLGPLTASAQGASTEKSHPEVLALSIGKLVGLIEPAAGAEPATVSANIVVVQAEGMGDNLVGKGVQVAFQAPDHLRVETEVKGRHLQLLRDGNQLWIYSPDNKFGLAGSSNVARFRSQPDQPDGTQLPRLKLPLPKEQLLVLPLLMQVDGLPDETVEDAPCRVLRATPQTQAISALNLPNVTLTLWVRRSDYLPVRLAVGAPDGRRVVVELRGLRRDPPWPAEKWRLNAPSGAKIETVALSHLTRFIPAAWSLLNLKIPTLGPATGEMKLVATEGNGRLEQQDGTQVLFLKGTPEEMGRQHGVLMRRQVRDLVDKVLFGVGVGSSFEKGRWFFGEIEDCQARIVPFVDPRQIREMDALAAAAGLEAQEVRLANFFPELFHCSGFAVYGQATVDGRLYHGRVLDYLRGVGLEPNATVIVNQPDQGHAWVNIGYAGFVGSVTAMNEKHLSIGEMGGRGEGNWDGKPMAQLVREVMEQAATLDEAIAIMRRGPRTCEYYYVIADGNTRQAVGIAATPTTFEVIRPGEAHPRLPHAIADAVLLSAGDRYEELARRVQANHGKLDADGARRLMDRPVAMNSNIHSALFAPETLDFWVANADSKNVASHCRYTHYNLAELLRSAPSAVSAK